jgi:hypothetical protein
VSCADPIPFETLVGLWTGEAADADRVEDHLFTCDDCAAAAAQLDRLAGALCELVPPVVSRSQRERYEARGLKILDVAFEPGAHGEAFFAPELDLVVFALRGDLGNAQRVDVEIADGGIVLFQFLHVPFDAARGEVLVACQQHFRAYQANASGDPEFRVFAHEGGTRRQVASYVIKHVWPPL